MHDLGVLVNSIACTDEFRQCYRAACEDRVALHLSEQRHLGFTHCQSGKILAEHWKFAPELVAAIEFHHHAEKSDGAPIVWLVHLADLLCRVCGLGYGYYEALSVNLADDPAWIRLAERFPDLARMDLVRLSIDIDGAMDEIVSTVDAVFRPQASAVQ